MNNEEWEDTCNQIQGLLKSLISHETTYYDCYETIKELMSKYRQGR